MEELEGGQAGTAGLEEAAGVEKDEGLVQLEERRPYGVLLTDEDPPRLREQVEGTEHLPLLAVGDREVRKGFGGLVAHAERPESVDGLLRHLGRVLAEVQLEVDLRQVHRAQARQIGIAQLPTGFARRLERVDGTAVLPAEVVQIGDVVVREGHQSGHSMRFAEDSGAAMGLEGPGKVVQADQAHRHVAQGCRDSLDVLQGQQPLIGLLVAVMKNKLEVYEGLVELSLGRGGLGPRVLAQQDERLDGGAQGPTHLHGLAHFLEEPRRLLVVLDRRLVLVLGVEGVALGAEALGDRLSAAQLARDELRCLRQGQRLFHVDPDLPGHGLAEPRHHLPAKQARMPGEESSAAALVSQPGQLRQEPLLAPIRLRRLAHRKPIFSSCRRKRVRQRPRMNPIEPSLSPRLAATSR